MMIKCMESLLTCQMVPAQTVGIQVESSHKVDQGRVKSVFLVSGFIVVDLFDTVILYLK